MTKKKTPIKPAQDRLVNVRPGRGTVLLCLQSEGWHCAMYVTPEEAEAYAAKIVVAASEARRLARKRARS
jgi:hypothetical protein